MTNRLANYLFCLIAAAALPGEALASGIAVSPAVVDIGHLPNRPSAASFYVSNPEADIQKFEIYSDDLAGLIRITPQVFALNPGATKKVELEVSSPMGTSKGRRNSYISIIASPLSESGLAVATGAKIKLQLHQAGAPGASGKNLMLGLMAAGSLLAALAWQKYKK